MTSCLGFVFLGERPFEAWAKNAYFLVKFFYKKITFFVNLLLQESFSFHFQIALISDYIPDGFIVCTQFLKVLHTYRDMKVRKSGKKLSSYVVYFLSGL